VKNFGKKSLNEIADLLERQGLNFGMRYEESPSEGVRILDMGTPPSRAAENAPDDDEEDED
jgi:DNA-directed RNA polymerase subunit alpha